MNDENYYRIGLDHVPVPEPDWRAWIQWYENADGRLVAKTELADGLITVSTIFLGYDASFGGRGIFFETMVIYYQPGAEARIDDRFQLRYSTWEVAERAHATIVRWFRETHAEGRTANLSDLYGVLEDTDAGQQ